MLSLKADCAIGVFLKCPDQEDGRGHLEGNRESELTSVFVDGGHNRLTNVTAAPK